MSGRGYALITGASAGLGAEFAAQYAARGIDLVLVARRRDRIEALARSLVRDYRVKVVVEAADLADPDTPQRLHAALSARGIAIATLVNNAGYGVPGGFMRQTLQTHKDFQQVLVNAVIALCYTFIPDMQQAHRGTIINIASLAGLGPASAGHTLYGAAKAWMIKFSESLSAELAPHGIKVLALCPGFTLTEFHDVNGMRGEVSRLPRWLWMSATDVVREGLAAVERDATIYIPGRINRVIAAGARALPARLALALIARRARDFRRVD